VDGWSFLFGFVAGAVMVVIALAWRLDSDEW
jgi:hypothetical protein